MLFLLLFPTKGYCSVFMQRLTHSRTHRLLPISKGRKAVISTLFFRSFYFPFFFVSSFVFSSVFLFAIHRIPLHQFRSLFAARFSKFVLLFRHHFLLFKLNRIANTRNKPTKKRKETKKKFERNKTKTGINK